MTRTKLATLIAGVAALVLLIPGVDLGRLVDLIDRADAPTLEQPTPQQPGSPDADGALAEVAARLEARGQEAPISYGRDYFGRTWPDFEGTGCDERNRVLQRDLHGPVLDADGCRVLTGVLHDPYTGTRIAFERGPETSPLVQIDHVVALAEAWHAGAWQWDDHQRQAFSNDLANLWAVDGPANQVKGDRDISAWTPLDAGGGVEAMCSFTATVISVYDTYQLRPTAQARSAMIDKATTCQNTP